MKQYYRINLNNNILSNDSTRESSDYFSGIGEEKFTIPIKGEENKYETFNMPIIGFLKVEDKEDLTFWERTERFNICDIITRKTIYFSQNIQEGEQNTHIGHLNYYSRAEMTVEEVADAIEKFQLNPKNLELYIKCLKKIEDYNRKCFLSTCERHNRSVKIVEEFEEMRDNIEKNSMERKRKK